MPKNTTTSNAGRGRKVNYPKHRKPPKDSPMMLALDAQLAKIGAPNWPESVKLPSDPEKAQNAQEIYFNAYLSKDPRHLRPMHQTMIAEYALVCAEIQNVLEDLNENGFKVLNPASGREVKSASVEALSTLTTIRDKLASTLGLHYRYIAAESNSSFVAEIRAEQSEHIESLDGEDDLLA